MSILLTGTGRTNLPNRVSNDELAARIDTNDNWIRSHTGIGSRYIADDNISCSDLALEAAKKALAISAGYSGECPAELERAASEAAAEIDIIILATATPDFIGCPSTACIVQDKLGAVKACAMDISAGCTGFVYGLETAAGLLSINSERKRALVIGSELLSRNMNWDDRSTCVLFGDGAGAVILEKTETPSRTGLVRSFLGADGSGKDNLFFNRGGSKNPFKPGETINKPIHVEMKGQEVYYFAVKAMCEVIEKLFLQEGININDVRWIIPHQANTRIIQTVGKTLKLPKEKIYLNIEEYANTSAASIPIALDELNRNGQLNKGDLIMTVGFGGGFTYGGNIIIW